MRRTRWAQICAGFVLGAAACAAPAESEPAAAISPPPAWGVGGQATEQAPDDAVLAAAHGLEPWWRGFEAPALSAAIAEALAAQPDLAAAAARVEAARAQARAVAGARLPQLALDLDLTRSRRNFIGLPVPGAPAVLPVTTDQHALGAQLAWEVDLSRRLAAADAAALADLQAAELDHAGLALMLAGQVARTWLLLAEQERRVEIQRELARIASQQSDLARRQLAAGTGAAAAVPAAGAAADAALAELARAEADASSTRAHLAALRGRAAGAPTADLAPPLPRLPAAVPAGLPADLLARRPDLAAAERRVRAARARRDQARAELWPRLTLTAGAGTSSSELGDLLSGDFRVWSLAAGLFQPVFAGGSLRARAAAAAATAEASEAEFVAYALRAFAEVESALAAEASWQEAATRLQAAAAAWSAEAARAERRFAAGTGDAAQTLAARARALEAEAAASSARLAALLHRVDLHLALGGGFRADTRP